MVSGKQSGEGVLAQFSIIRGHIEHIVAFTDNSRVAGAVSNFGKFHIRRDKSSKAAGRSTDC
ncbi:hypothetical protein EVA_20767 [gut metagenome]|uniref:Uncharacterized protein n=1 Tax=gut metagenome TaxID=749906 RepID=J9BUA1_9ZZZZ